MIQARRLNKLYGREKAIEDLSLRVDKGEVVGLLGPDGAGKTTAMRILAGYFPPNSGTVKVAGYDLLRQPRPAKSRIGYLPERPPLYPHMRVDHYLSFVDAAHAGHHGGARRPLAKRLAEVKEQCGLSGAGSGLINRLSSVQRRRLGLAQALIHDPEVLILDEPTEGLDPEQITEVRKLIRELAASRAVLLSTHVLPEVGILCGRVLILHRGRLIAQGSPRELRTLLGRGALLEMQVDGPVESLPRRLKAVVGVRDAILEESAGQGRLLLVEAQAGADVRAASARTVIESGCALLEMKTREASLEDIYLRLTTEDRSVTPPRAETSSPESGAAAQAVGRESEVAR